MLGAAIVGDGLFYRSRVVHQPGIIHAFQLAGGRQGHFARVLFHKHIADTLVAIGESLFAHSEAGPRTNVRDAALFGRVVGDGTFLGRQLRVIHAVFLFVIIAGIPGVQCATVRPSGVALDDRAVFDGCGVVAHNHAAAIAGRRVVGDAAAADVERGVITAVHTAAIGGRGIVFHRGVDNAQRTRIIAIEFGMTQVRAKGDACAAAAVAVCAGSRVAGDFAVFNRKIAGFANAGWHINVIYFYVLIIEIGIDEHTAARLDCGIVVDFAVGQGAHSSAAIDIDAAAVLFGRVIVDI